METKVTVPAGPADSDCDHFRSPQPLIVCAKIVFTKIVLTKIVHIFKLDAFD